MKQCSRISLKIKLQNNLEIEGALVAVEGNNFAKLFLKSATGKELSFETDLLFLDSPTEDMLKVEIFESLQELVDWSLADFPLWLRDYLEVGEDHQLSIKEISRLWSMKQMYFGMFRIASEIGVVTSRIPAEAVVVPAKSVEISLKQVYSIKG